MACPECQSKDVRCTQSNLVTKEYVCNKCKHEFTTPHWGNAFTTLLTGVLAILGLGGGGGDGGSPEA